MCWRLAGGWADESDLGFSMMSYWQLLMLVLPVFAVIAIGVVVRRVPDRMGSA